MSNVLMPKDLSQLGFLLLWLAIGVVLGSFLTYYLMEMRKVAGGDAYVFCIALLIFIAGASCLILANYREYRSGRSK